LHGFVIKAGLLEIRLEISLADSIFLEIHAGELVFQFLFRFKFVQI
jgi:hypothetical protein